MLNIIYDEIDYDYDLINKTNQHILDEQTLEVNSRAVLLFVTAIIAIGLIIFCLF